MNQVVFCLLFFFATSTHVLSQVITIDEKSPKAINITDQLEYFIDKDRVLELEELSQFAELDGHFMDFGFTRARIWLRFEVQNLTGNKLVLTFNNRLTDRVELIVDPNRPQAERSVSGGTIPYQKRPVSSPIPTFILKPNNHVQQVFVSIESTDEITGKLVLKQEQDYWKDEKRMSVAYGFYYGAMSLLLLVCWGLYLKTRDHWYLYVSPAIAFLMVWILSHSGNINDFVKINGPALFWNISQLNFLLAHLLVLLIVSQKVFSIKARSPWLSRLLNGLSILIFVIVMVTSTHYHPQNALE
ncbi:MAG: hypothetical protein ETSY1_17675 [Candidatus Entotheonella factor]|uniref:7TM-DISM receptor extracellular domain-containing protein n=1 Tax=Entotheonella factor TaxID=1429438 RepID=W4LLX4_ENTF1|nr:MAG: hypothetical protein ETSY1_17675 [Candidatus Entotheonella factor]